MIINEQEIKEASSISHVVGSYIDLQKNKACCPFHHEKTPSFSVNEKRNMFKCFGCGVSGDPIQFVMDHEGKTYPEALESLAKINGISIERKKLSKEEQEEHNRRLDHHRSLYRHNQLVADWLHEYTFERGQKKLSDWWPKIQVNKTVISAKTIEDFQLSAVPDEWEFIAKVAESCGWDKTILQELGLIKIKKDGTFFDVFRNRIIFPIQNHLGQVVGFDGRSFEENPTAKYFNSKENSIFKKRELLYGLFQCKKEIRKTNLAYIVEGRTDVTTLYDRGLTNVVGTGGTALTIDQAKLLRKYTQKAVLLYDGDEAGVTAMMKAIPILVKAELNVAVLLLPEDHDPDSFVSAFGVSSLLALQDVNMRKGVLWLVKKTLGDEPNTFDREEAIKLAGQLLADTKDESLRDILITQLTTKSYLNIGKTVLKDEIKRNLEQKDPKKKRLTDDQQRDIWNYGIFEENNCYYSTYGNDTNQDGYQISNFIIQPIFLLRQREGSKRLVEIVNSNNQSFVMDIDSDSFVELGPFKKVVESQGNFIFTGKAEQFTNVKRKVYSLMQTAYPITTLGHHREGFYSFGNGIAYKGQFYPVDEYGVVKFNDRNFFLPAFSKILDGDYADDVDVFGIEKKFIFKESKISFKDWSQLFYQVHGENGIFGMLFYMSALYRDFIYSRFNFFPHLNLFGPPGSGKSYLAWSISAMWGEAIGPFMLDQGTNVGFFRRFAQIRNGISWKDEYNNSIHPRRIQALKAAYDGAGHEKGTMSKDNKTITTPIRSACIISGQELPTADIALFKRTVNLLFSKVGHTNEEEERGNKLNKWEKSKTLSAITVGLLRYRSKIEEEFNQTFDKLMVHYKTELAGDDRVEDRILKNTVILVSIFKILSDELEFPFDWQTLDEATKRNVVRQGAMISRSNEVSIFWNIVEYLLSQHIIKEDVDFKIRSTSKLTVQIDKQSKEVVLNGAPMVLFISLKSIHGLYLKTHREQHNKPGIGKTSLEHYLRTSKGYLGSVRSTRIGSYNTSCLAFKYDVLELNLQKIAPGLDGDCEKCQLPVTKCSCFNCDFCDKVKHECICENPF